MAATAGSIGRWALALALGLGLLPGARAGAPPLMSAEAQTRLAAVGRVNLAAVTERKMCTGTLVGPDLVLTAAHCLVQPVSGAPAELDDLHFVAGWRKGDWVAHGRVAAIARPASHDAARPGTDLALMRLRTPITAADPMPTGAVGTAALTIPGYRRDRPHALSRHEGCSLRRETARLLILGCRVVAGTSGAPVISGAGDEARVVGVVAGIGRYDGRPVTYAARIAGRLPALRARLPSRALHAPAAIGHSSPATP